MTFGQANATNEWISEMCDGILGLGWPALASGGQKTFMQFVQEQQVLEQNVIGIYMRR